MLYQAIAKVLQYDLLIMQGFLKRAVCPIHWFLRWFDDG